MQIVEPITCLVVDSRTHRIVFVGLCHVQSKKGDKDQDLIQSSTTPDQGYQWESGKTQLNIKNESQ